MWNWVLFWVADSEFNFRLEVSLISEIRIDRLLGNLINFAIITFW